MKDIKKEKIKNLSKSELKKNIENRTDNLLFDDISKQMNKVMEENNINKQQNKKGIDIITADLQKQNDKWKEKLKTESWQIKSHSTGTMPSVSLSVYIFLINPTKCAASGLRSLR